MKHWSWVLIGGLCLIAEIGCGGDPMLPTGEPLDEPERIEEGRLMAMFYLGLLVPEDSLSVRIARDLDAISDFCENDHPALAHIMFCPYMVSGIRLEMESSYCDSIGTGLYADWDSLNATYGLDGVSTYEMGICFVGLSFAEVKNPFLLAKAYAGLPGVDWAGPAQSICSFSGSNIWGRFSEDKNEYLMRHGYGDCPAGCIDEDFYLLEVTDGQVSSFEYLGDTAPPELAEFGAPYAWHGEYRY